MVTAREAPSGFGKLWEGLDIQRAVLGALIMRELHTRYGRENIGYAWLVIEPMLLAAAVASLHGSAGGHGLHDLLPVPFALGGYCMFMVFRSVMGRSEATLESNKPLLFHRTVTILDMLLARVALEAASTFLAMVILLGGAWTIGLADLPAYPLTMLAAFAYMVWFSFALGMSVCVACYYSKAVAKFVHPLTYIAMPLSGAFFLLTWIPEPYRDWLAWLPLTQIFELFHTGQFASVRSPYVDLVYLTGCCLALTAIGLVALRIVRNHVHLS